MEDTMNDLILRALSPNIERARAAVASERAKRPNASNRELAERVIRGTSWKLGATGFASGLPSNPFYTIPAGTLESLTTINEQVQLGHGSP